MVGTDEAFTKTRLPPKPQLSALSARGVPSAVVPTVSPDRTDLYRREPGVRRAAQSADAISASVSTDAADRGEVLAGAGRRRHAGQEPGTGTASLSQPATAAWQQPPPPPALNTPTLSPGRKHACVFLAGQRLPGSWFRLGVFTSSPVLGNCGYGSGRSGTRAPEVEKVQEGIVWLVCHFVNVS